MALDSDARARVGPIQNQSLAKGTVGRPRTQPALAAATHPLTDLVFPRHYLDRDCDYFNRNLKPKSCGYFRGAVPELTERDSLSQGKKDNLYFQFIYINEESNLKPSLCTST